MDNGNELKWIIGTMAIEKNQNSGGNSWVPAKKHCQFSLLTEKMGQMAWIGSAV